METLRNVSTVSVVFYIEPELLVVPAPITQRPAYYPAF